MSRSIAARRFAGALAVSIAAVISGAAAPTALAGTKGQQIEVTSPLEFSAVRITGHNGYGKLAQETLNGVVQSPTNGWTATSTGWWWMGDVTISMISGGAPVYTTDCHVPGLWPSNVYQCPVNPPSPSPAPRQAVAGGTTFTASDACGIFRGSVSWHGWRRLLPFMAPTVPPFVGTTGKLTSRCRFGTTILRLSWREFSLAKNGSLHLGVITLPFTAASVSGLGHHVPVNFGRNRLVNPADITVTVCTSLPITHARKRVMFSFCGPAQPIK
jgi:hypothetical protein